MATCTVDLDRRHIEIEVGQCATQRFALGGDKVPMQLLCKRGEIRYGLVRFTTLTQKVMQLIHGVGITGQAVAVLQCLQRGSPLREVVHVITPLFQSGEAPSRGPRSIHVSTE